jgi:hypothetical protein
MPVDHSPHNKRGRRGEPSLWTYEPANDAVSLLENALRGDKLADGPQSLLEENAQLRKLVVQLSHLLGDLPATTTDETQSGRAEVSGGLDDVIVSGAGLGP